MSYRKELEKALDAKQPKTTAPRSSKLVDGHTSCISPAEVKAQRGFATKELVGAHK